MCLWHGVVEGYIMSSIRHQFRVRSLTCSRIQRRYELGSPVLPHNTVPRTVRHIIFTVYRKGRSSEFGRILWSFPCEKLAHSNSLLRGLGHIKRFRVESWSVEEEELITFDCRGDRITIRYNRETKRFNLLGNGQVDNREGKLETVGV